VKHPSLGVPRRILVHHTASPRTTTYEEVERWHHERRWRAIGYHYFIPANGIARIGRPLPELGAHCAKFNTGSIGICVAGDNTRPEHRWSLRQVESLKALIRHITSVWPYLADDIYGHRDYGETLCPGLDVRALLAGSMVVG
jgi:N-acetyl-anhydromuramyl-L-alanine amidase AmpD